MKAIMFFYLMLAVMPEQIDLNPFDGDAESELGDINPILAPYEHLSVEELREQLHAAEEEFRDHWSMILATQADNSEEIQRWKEICAQLPHPLGREIDDDRVVMQLQYLTLANQVAVSLRR